MLEVARQVTNQSNNEIARKLLIQRLNKSDMYFNTEDIPKNESDENAYRLCSDVERAKMHCPVRWRTIQNWFNLINKVILFCKTTLTYNKDIN